MKSYNTIPSGISVLLYNDDCHDIINVMKQIVEATKMLPSHHRLRREQAAKLTTDIHKDGWAVVYSSDEDGALSAAEWVDEKLRSIGLQSEVYDTQYHPMKEPK
jgi:ATP-dependent Clp protease adapter protein ClpS